jgi:serine/threonine protein kinase
MDTKGDVIGGYRLRNPIQTGQISQVFEVVELSSSRHFAMKILLPEAAEKPEHRQNLFYEAEVGLQLTHDHIIRIVKVAERKERVPYFVMEYFPAGSLRARMMKKEHDFIKEKLPSILRQSSMAFAYMHAKGWLHRDIKPDNMLVNALGELRVIDFAIAQRISTGFLTRLFRRKSTPQGTRSYMSPEQIRGELLDARSDIYSFGATVYELVTGRPPFRGKDQQDLLRKHFTEKPIPPKDLVNDVTDEFNALILSCLEKLKENRPPHFHDILIKIKNMRLFKSQPRLKD